jgi:hypothetical protein
MQGVLGDNSPVYDPIEKPYRHVDRIAELEAALREIIRLRLATDEGTLARRADAMWQLATNVLKSAH